MIIKRAYRVKKTHTYIVLGIDITSLLYPMDFPPYPMSNIINTPSC